MGRRIFQIFTIFATLVVVTVLRSSAEKLSFKNYSTKDGLVHNNVACLYQDSQGYLWIGTTEGLSRFDGAKFTNYFLEQDSSFDISATFTRTVYEDRQGNLWIGLELFGGVGKFNLASQERSFVHNLIIPDTLTHSNDVKTILQDTAGKLWFGTGNGIFTFENGVFQNFALKLDTIKIIEVAIAELYEDRHGTILIATNKGLYRYNKKLDPQLAEIPVPGTSQVNTIYEDNEGNLWIGTNDIGLMKLKNYLPNDQTSFYLKAYTIADGLPHYSVKDILQDNFGTLWIATWGGLCKLIPGTEEFITYTTANGLPNDNVVDIMQDWEGNLWIATTNGISKLNSEAFINYGTNDGLPHEFLLEIAPGTGNDFWFIGTSGACHFTGDSFVPVEALRGKHVLAVAVENRDIVWFGLTNGAIKWSHGRIIERYDTTNGLPDNAIHFIFKDSRSALWLGHCRGASRLKEGKLHHFYGDTAAPILNGMSEINAKFPLVIGMDEDPEGTIWFATYRHGVYKLPADYDSDSNWVKVAIPISFQTRAIYCDRDNKIWIGTQSDGVFRYDPQTGALTNYTTADGLSSNFILSIFPDSKGNPWIGTTRGANRLDGTSFKHYSTREGLAGDAVYDGIEDKQGCLWFTTSNGLSRYNPVLERVCAIAPPVYVTSFRIFGKEAQLKNGIHLPASQHSVSFEYVGISFKDETQVRYQYRLNGLDGNWSDLTDRRYVNYTNLAPGKYSFEVRARNVDGVWSHQPAIFSFSIATHLWQRWWFIGLMITVLGGIVIGGHRYRLNRFLELERMRSRIATDLHDEIGTTLSSIALFSEMARQEIQNIAPKVAIKLKEITMTAQQMVETMRDIVWSINPSNDTVEDIVLYMKQFAAEVLEAKGIEFAFVIPSELAGLRLPMDIRHHFYLIYKEAINNMIQHSGCSHAEIHLVLGDGILTLVISDDGKGFERIKPCNGSGLKNMRKRAQAINGTLKMASTAGKGTTITLSMPI